MQKLPNFRYEKKLWKRGFTVVAGADEVGRGAWAGPIVAAAVALAPLGKREKGEGERIEGFGINDSKKLRPRQREKCARFIKENALAWGIGEVPVAYINRCGIVRATRTAFRRAVADCNSRLSNISNIKISNARRVEFLLIDAFYVPYTRGIKRRNQLAVVKGDEKLISVAAASVIAKVYRDKLMVRFARGRLAKLGRYSVYGWARNKGYGTRQHREAILQHGLTRLHRKDFVKKL